MKSIVIISSITVLLLSFKQPKKPQSKIDSSPQASINRGVAVYRKECMSCHQADGGGVPHLNPPLSENTDVLGDKKKIISIVLKGMEDRIPLDGEYYSNSMASHAHLSNLEIADVLTYIRASFGNKASAVTPAEVALVRGGKKK